jgi:hypothetical protein
LIRDENEDENEDEAIVSQGDNDDGTKNKEPL